MSSVVDVRTLFKTVVLLGTWLTAGVFLFELAVVIRSVV